MPLEFSSYSAVKFPSPDGNPSPNVNDYAPDATPLFEYTVQDADETWENLTYSHSVLGGFRPNNENLTDELRRQNPGAPEKLVPGVKLVASWHHLRTRKVGGYSVYGNWVGPGAQDLWFTRPTNVFDLAGKLHDFAYEVNGLSFRDEKRPEMFWSRIAKADYLFFKLLEPFQPLPDSLSTSMQSYARTIFHPFPKLFRRDDCFINPLIHLPKDWLCVPHQYLAPNEKPNPRRVRSGSTPGSNHLPRAMYEYLPDYRASMQGVDTLDAWIPRLDRLLPDNQRQNFANVITELRALGTTGRVTVISEKPWSREVTRDYLLA